jgi:hypothetical protein
VVLITLVVEVVEELLLLVPQVVAGIVVHIQQYLELLV